MAVLHERPIVEGATRTCSFHVDDILRARFHQHADVTYQDARENVALSLRLAAGRRLPVLVDLRAVRSHSAEARAYFTGPEGQRVCAAAALVVGSPVSRVVALFLVHVNRPATPTRTFTCEREAESWLRQFVEEPTA